MYFCSTIVYKKIILRTKIVCMDKQVVVRSSLFRCPRLLNRGVRLRQVSLYFASLLALRYIEVPL